MHEKQLWKLLNHVIDTLKRGLEYHDNAVGVNLYIAKTMGEFAQAGVITDYTVDRLPNLEMFDVFFCADVRIKVTDEFTRIFRVTLRRGHGEQAA